MTFQRHFKYATGVFVFLNTVHSKPIPTTNLLVPGLPTSTISYTLPKPSGILLPIPSATPRHPRPSLFTGSTAPALLGNSNGTISLSIQVLDNEIGYVAPLQLGETNQTFNIFLDTINFVSFVDGSGCDSCGNHTLLDQSYALANGSIGFSFNNRLGSENVSLHEVNAVPIKLGGAMGNLSVYTAFEADNVTASAPFDGVMGLALGSSPDQFLPSIVQQLADQGVISAPVITFKLPPITNTTSQSGGVILGNPDAFIGNTTRVTQANATTNGFWDFQATLNVEGTTVVLSDSSTNSTFTARINTRENAIGMPSSDMQALIDATPGAKRVGGGFALPCNATTNVSFDISGQLFTLLPQHFISNITSKQFDGFCFARFSTQNDTVWTLGSPFTNSFYISLDYGSKSVSIADF